MTDASIAFQRNENTWQLTISATASFLPTLFYAGLDATETIVVDSCNVVQKAMDFSSPDDFNVTASLIGLFDPVRGEVAIASDLMFLQDHLVVGPLDLKPTSVYSQQQWNGSQSFMDGSPGQQNPSGPFSRPGGDLWVGVLYLVAGGEPASADLFIVVKGHFEPGTPGYTSVVCPTPDVNVKFTRFARNQNRWMMVTAMNADPVGIGGGELEMRLDPRLNSLSIDQLIIAGAIPIVLDVNDAKYMSIEIGATGFGTQAYARSAANPVVQWLTNPNLLTADPSETEELELVVEVKGKGPFVGGWATGRVFRGVKPDVLSPIVFVP